MPVTVLLILYMLHSAQESITHNIVLFHTPVAVNKSEKSKKTRRLIGNWYSDRATYLSQRRHLVERIANYTHCAALLSRVCNKKCDMYCLSRIVIT
jgi:hypothetical protein